MKQTEQLSPANQGHSAKRRLILSGLLVVLVLLGIGLFGLGLMSHSTTKHTTTVSQGQAPAAAVTVVQITPSGFLPDTIAVNANTKVVWVNEDVMPHLPAADPYPSHTSLPNFVAPRALGQRETYSYLFTKSETIHYHDDLNPTVTGTVEVR